MIHRNLAIWRMRIGQVVVLLAVQVLQPARCNHTDLTSVITFLKTHVPGLMHSDYQHLEKLNADPTIPEEYEAVLASLAQLPESSLSNISGNIYRRSDGVGNNLRHPLWGASLHVQRRLLPNNYDDGQGIPHYRSSDGSHLPSPRSASLKCFPHGTEGDLDQTDRESSQLVWQFGQFIDHDVALTEHVGKEGCCRSMTKSGIHNDMFNKGTCFPIHMEPEDRHFDNKGCMEFLRSVAVYIDDVREQINGITSFVDASNVYGSSEDATADMRSFTGGLMKVSGDNLLPDLDKFKCIKTTAHKCLHAGDIRVNEFPGLTSMHTVFHREHNSIAAELAIVNPHWDDEKLFQVSRKILTAEYQHIVYNEFVTKVVGPAILRSSGIESPYQYDPELNPGISNPFACSAFRYGHSQVNGVLNLSWKKKFNISEVFFRPHTFFSSKDFHFRDIIRNQLRKYANKVDKFFTSEITDHLFLGVDGPNLSFDLTARSLQRERDHGLQSYVGYLDLALGKGGVDPNRPITLPACLRSWVYKSVNDLDLFVGGISESPVEGGLVGPTFANLISEQFSRLKHGDRFWYATPDQRIGFTSAQLSSIKEMTLSGILCRNTGLAKIQPRALDSLRSRGNSKVWCAKIPSLDLWLWKEED